MKQNINSKKWGILLIVLFIIGLFSGGLINYIVDPFFHYHSPNDSFAYTLNGDYERYYNDGMERHFDYDAVIIGTSMTENFKTSLFDELFDCKSIKLPFTAATYKEIDGNLERAFSYNPDIKYVLRAIDYLKLTEDYDAMWTEITYPTYLYDNNLFNDVNYLLNKTVITEGSLPAIIDGIAGKESTSLDEYANWNDKFDFGKDALDKIYTRPDKNPDAFPFTEEIALNLNETLEKNILETVKNHPKTEFYFYFTPYSFYFFDQQNQYGMLNAYLLAEKQAIEKMLSYENIHLYSFFLNTDLIFNLDNYMDIHHYNGNISDEILYWIKNNEYEITKENYEEYCAKEWEIYLTCDYDKYFE